MPDTFFERGMITTEVAGPALGAGGEGEVHRSRFLEFYEMYKEGGMVTPDFSSGSPFFYRGGHSLQITDGRFVFL